MANRFTIVASNPADGYVFSLDDCTVHLAQAVGTGHSSTGSLIFGGDKAYSAYATYCPSDSAALRPNNLRGQQFSALAGAVAKLHELPEYDTLHVGEATCIRVSELLGLLHTQTEVAPPKLFPQDGETLALTWTQGRFMRMLSVDEEDLSMTDVDKRSQRRCMHELNDTDNLQALLPALGVLPKVATAS